MLKVYLTGIIILVSAIVLNVLSGLLGIAGWYDFLSGLSREGKVFLRQLGVLDYAWLFVLYPALLGLSALLADRLFKLLY